MVDVQRAYPRFQQAGGEVAVVTMGTAEQTASFRQRLRLDLQCLGDPQRRAYRAFGLPQARLGQVAGPSVWLPGARALLRGGLGMPIGDPLQLHGTFVIDTGGLICYAHYPKHSADLPSHVDVLDACRSAAVH